MKIRIKFSKTGRLKYIGHLDLLNVWNRAIKSAKLPVSYSKGFNPHMLVSFAAPLPLGILSASEYVDVDFDASISPVGIPAMLNTRFPEGLEALCALELSEPYKRVASVVTAAEYKIEAPFAIDNAQISGFLSQDTVEIMKKTKRKTEITNILPDILYMEAGKSCLYATLSCGSAKNLKPSLLMEAFCSRLEISVPAHEIRITRLEILGPGKTGFLEPLSKLL